MRQLGLAALAMLLFASTLAAADLCPATDAQSVVTQISYKDGQVVASGTWAVSGGATGAMLEFRVDNDRLQAEARTGTSGIWSITQPFSVCDRPIHALRVLVHPAVDGGEGRQSFCLDRMKRSEAAMFQFSCAARAEVSHCDWECGDGEDARCAGLCLVTATGGRLKYVPYQGTEGQEAQKFGDPSEGPWNLQVSCKRGEKITFTVRDNYGRGKPAPPVERQCGEEPAGE